jgi:hypothetical protein
VLLANCAGKDVVQKDFTLAFHASCDDEPVDDVAISVNGSQSGRTDGDGILHITVTGEEGQALPLHVECPDSYRRAEAPNVVRLLTIRGFDSEQSSLHRVIPVQCVPRERIAAVVVRAPEAPGVPVLLYGEEVARTDSSGVAHLEVQLPPHNRFALELDTREHPRLRPQNPTKSFRVPDREEIFLFEQPFAVAPEPRPAKRQRRRRRRPQKQQAPRPHIPTRI